MTYPTNNKSTVSIKEPAPRALVKHLMKFAVCMTGTIAFCLSAYVMTVDRLVEQSAIPATYKWFLLKEVPGPRIIFESGSNSHHAIDTEFLGAELGITAINIADNAGYSLEDKVTRLETFARAGDVVVLPLEWSFYSREKLTDAYVGSIFSENRDYYWSMPVMKRVQRALSLPPEKIITELNQKASRPALETESSAHQLFRTALTLPTGHFSRETSIGPGFGVADQSCDDYILGKQDVRQNLKLGKNIKPALERLKRLKAQGIDIHFAWPVLAGEGCMSDPAYVKDFRREIEAAVNQAGFEFLGTLSQSLYSQDLQDDTPYHLISKGTDIHTAQMIGFLEAQGHVYRGRPVDIKTFARHRLLELELSEVVAIEQPALPVGQIIRMDDKGPRPHVDFSAGWWVFESYGRWMRDNRAMFRVTLPSDLPENTVLKIQGITKSGRAEYVNISVNGNLISSGLFGQDVPLMVPVADLPSGETLSVFVELPEAGTPQSPKDLGESQDARSMTLHLQTMELTQAVVSPVIDQQLLKKELSTDLLKATKPAAMYESAPNVASVQAPAPEVSIESLVALNTSDIQPTNIEYGEGWWAQETEGRWMRAGDASFDLELPVSITTNLPKDYILRLTGDFFSEKPRAVRISIDGQFAGYVDIKDNGIISIPVEMLETGRSLKVALNFPVSQLKSPKDLGFSTDERTLTYFLKSAELVWT